MSEDFFPKGSEFIATSFNPADYNPLDRFADQGGAISSISVSKHMYDALIKAFGKTEKAQQECAERKRLRRKVGMNQQKK